MLGRWIRRLIPWSRPALYRRKSTHVRGRILRGSELGPTREDAHQTYRARQDEKARALPLPPLLDPVVIEQRSRWERMKERPSGANPTPFQKRLLENPFAHALASPVRQCRATLISLPVAFLTSLHARPHPTTNHPWLLPIALTTDTKQLGPPVRFIGRQAVVKQLGKKRAWERVLYARVLEKLGSHNVRNMVWREDMAELVLDKMRERLVNKLSWNFGFKGRMIPVASPRTEDIDHVEDISSVLVFHSLRTRADDLQGRTEAIQLESEKWSSYFAKNFSTKLDPHASPNVTHASPRWYNEPLVPHLQPRLQFPTLHFRTTIWQGREVAVYSLFDLLGKEKAHTLFGQSKYCDISCVTLKRSRHNVPVEILIMQVQAYIAQSRP